MNLDEYKLVHTSALPPRTVTFLIKDNQVLLGFKKTGFGKGNYIGIGGKVEENELIDNAAKREVLEEIKVEVNKLKPVGIVNFYFPKESWNQAVHIFVVTEWNGIPSESEEIKPEWFNFDKLPFNKMWDDAHYWIPSILNGESVNADFLFNEDLKVVDSMIK